MGSGTTQDRQHRLLDAITRMQSRYIRDVDSREVFDKALADILAITDSEYGFIGEVLYTDDQQPYLKTYAITNIAWDKDTRSFYEANAPAGLEFFNLKTLFGEAMLTGKPVIANHPAEDPRSGGLPEGHPSLDRFLGVPFYLGERMIGMVGIANRSEGYDQDLIDFLQPLFNTFAYIIDALRTDREKQTAETEFHNLYSRLIAVVDTVVDGILTIDRRGIVNSFNPAAEKMFAYRAEEVIGRNVSMLMPEPYHREHDGYLENYLSTGERKIIGIGREVVGLRKDGSTFPLDLAVSEMVVSGEQMFTGIVRDITHRKRVERMKNEFVSTVSHELRTPLTSIRGSLGLVLGGVAGELPQQARHLIDIAYSNCERLVELINDILDVEKIAAGKLAFKYRVQPIMDLVEQALESNQAYGQEFGVSFKLTQRAEGKVKVDPNRLLQVMANLLSNAAKFSPRDSQVEIAVDSLGESVRVSVLDHGEGIPQEFHDHIFKKFSQADSSDIRQKGGTGLGLVICKSIIENMGGTIDFESKEGQGCRFFYELPLLDEEAYCSGQGLVHQALKLLVCEDDVDTADWLALILTGAGYDVDTCHSAEAAKEMLARTHYIAMSLDLNLPGQDGIDLIEELRSRSATKNLPIVVVSVDAEDAQKNAAEDASIYWLNKPVTAETLRASLTKVMSRSRKAKPWVLHVEADKDIQEIVAQICKPIADFESANSIQAARRRLEDSSFDLLLLEWDMPDGQGQEVLDHLKQLNNAPPVVILSASEAGNQQLDAVEAELVKSLTSNEELFNTINEVLSRYHH